MFLDEESPAPSNRKMFILLGEKPNSSVEEWKFEIGVCMFLIEQMDSRNFVEIFLWVRA